MLRLSDVGGIAPPPPPAMAAARQRDNSYVNHCVVVTVVKDPLANTVEIEKDYRVLGPVLVTDPNRNRSAVKVDDLGLVIATAVM